MGKMRKAIAAILAAVLTLGLAPSLAMADLTIDDYPDGTYRFESFESSTGMVRTDSSDGPALAVVKGDTVTLVLDIYNPNKYDGLWHGKRSSAPANTHGKGVVDALLLPEGDYAGYTDRWTDKAGLAGEPGAVYKAVRFLVPMAKDDFEAMMDNDVDEDFYFSIRNALWAGADQGKWANAADECFMFGEAERISDSTEVPDSGGKEVQISGTYSLLDLDTAFGMPGILKAQEYFDPRLIVAEDGTGTLMIATATYRYDHMALGVMEDLTAGRTTDVTGAGLYQAKLTGDRGTDIKGYVFSFPLDADQVKSIVAQGKAKLPFLVRYVEKYDNTHDADWYQAENGQLSFSVAKKSASTAVPELSADYSGVIDALSKVPSDLSGYESGSVAALQAAIDAVDSSKKASQQAQVNAMEKAIRDALAGLGHLADYTKVDAALAKVPSDLSKYTPATAQALFDAQNAVVRNLLDNRQADVDAMATAIENAISGLVQKYVPVRDAIRALPLPKNVKTTDEAAINSAESQFKSLSSAQQAKINKNLQTKLKNCVKALKIVKKRAADAAKRAAEAEKNGKKDNGKADNGKTGNNGSAENGKSGNSDSNQANAQSGKTGNNGSANSQPSSAVNAQTGNQSAIAAARAGATGAKTSASSNGNSSSSSSANKNNTSKKDGDDADKDDESASDKDKSSDKDKDKAKDKDGKKVDTADGSVKEGAEGAGEAATDELEATEAESAGVAASVPFFLLGLAAAGVVSFVAAFAYRNRRAVKVRY